MTLYPTVSVPCYRPWLAAAIATSLTACSSLPSREPPSRPLPGEAATGAVVDPNLARPDVSVRKIGSDDLEIGAYAGALVVSRDVVAGIYGVRGGYHVSDSLWVEAHYTGSSKQVFDSAANLLGFQKPPRLNYDAVGLSLAYDVLPGDLYFRGRYTLPIALYVIGGAAYVSYDSWTGNSGGDFASYNVGGGLKLLPRDWLSVRFELRDQIWDRAKTDQNLELTFGLSVFF